MTTDSISPRRRTARVAVTATALAALIGSTAAAPAFAVPADMFCEVPGQELAIAPISGLEEGDDVTWMSTVKGTAPTTFTGEYLGKLDNGLGYDASGKPRDLLLVRLDGDVVNGATGSLAAGVWAGASGSPVYDADGALVGAVSYGFSSLPDNVAGVTPAAYMKTIGELPGVQRMDAAEQRQVAQMAGEEVRTSRTAATIRPLEPVRVTTGTTAAALDRVTSKLAKNVEGFRGVRSAGLAIDGGADSGADYPIVVGGNIAVSYAYGAVGEATVGTVTAICGDDVFAYGHPNNFNSKLAANIHGASAARIVPDLLGSYKMVSAIGKVKGRLVDDRLAGIKARLGAGTATVPITTTSIVGSHRSKAVTHVSESLLVAGAAAAHLGADAVRMLDNQWEGSAKVTWSIDYQRENGKIRTLNNANRVADPQMFPEAVGYEMSEDIALLQMNPFEDVKVLAVRVTAVYDPDYRAARVAGVEMRQNGVWKKVSSSAPIAVTRGKTYAFRTVLAPAPGAKRVTAYAPFSVQVPAIQQRNMNVRVNAPIVEDDFALEMAPDFGAYIAALDANARADALVVSRRYTSLNGSPRAWTSPFLAPTIVVPDGKTASFTLQVAPPKKKSSR